MKTALGVILREQMVLKPELCTILTEVKEILITKPLVYVSTDAANPDLFTPHIVLKGLYNSCLPQFILDPMGVVEL